MAKKKTKKNIKLSDNYELTQKVIAIPKEEKEDLKAVRGKLYNPIGNAELYESIIALEQRIDRIVMAIGKSKSVRGL